MRGLKLYMALFFLVSGLCVMAQEAPEADPILIQVRGRVVSSADRSPVPYAHLINNRTHSGTITNADGYFNIEMLNIDSLVVSCVGFFREAFKVPYNYQPDSTVVFHLRPVSIGLPQVNVRGDKSKVNMDGIPIGKPINIDPKLRGDAFNERPPVIAALFNPISYWEYYLSKREKRKRNVREAMTMEKNWELYSKNYNKQVVMSLTGLDDKQADDFMIWFNSQDILPYTSTEYQIRAAIKHYFKVYKSEGHLE